MNLNILLGTITFLVWSTLSSWFYVCNIKGMCNEIPTIAVTLTPDPVLAPIKAPSKVVSAPVKEKRLEAIKIVEEDIFFAINSSQFLDSDYVKLFVSDLKEKTEGRTIEISIKGYTCDLGNSKYNLALGLQRAQALQSYLSSQGVNNIKVSSGGEIASVDGTDEERANHRKVSITIKSIDS